MRWCKKSSTVAHGGVLSGGKVTQLADTPCCAGIEVEWGERDMVTNAARKTGILHSSLALPITPHGTLQSPPHQRCNLC
jgi:hypothetical protein